MIVPSLSYGNLVFRKMVVLLLFLMNSAWVAQAQQNHAPQHVNVVALMVEFQPDTTRFTTGNGTFDGPLFEGVAPPRFDPLPHNGPYFEAHLAFLEDYISRVSDGKTEVETFVLPNIVRVSGKMGAYSPTGKEADSDAELGKLGRFVEEAWTLAAAQGVQFPASVTSENTAFVIFHAGVGRDIELIGTTLNKTPEDIPSLFLGEATLSRLGVSPIRAGGVDIQHSLVIPRTESRLGYDFLADEPFLVELSINGLLAASFLNYLGVPDLFNTKTGESAIGPFDVMDALGIFAFGGLFPPEPSAWTKAYLGWADLITFRDAQDADVSLAYVGHESRNEAAKIEISDAEYFLIENRHRDPENDGVHMKVWNNGVVEDVVFPNADPGFNDVTISGFEGGVVISVDQYDFALPGGEDEFGNPLLGGLLIWHVDENRILESIESNAVNADPNRRGLDLEEADSAQDIGFASVGGGFFGPQFELGSPFDFWFRSNPVKVRTSTGQDLALYTNSFTSTSFPSSHANNGSETPISVTNISDPSDLMTFNLDQQAQLTWNISDRKTFETSKQFASLPGLMGEVPLEDGSGRYPFVFSAMDDGSYTIKTSTGIAEGLLNVWPVSGSFGLVGLSSTGFVWLDHSGVRRDIPINSGNSFVPTSNIAWFRQNESTFFRVGIEAGGGFREVVGELRPGGAFSASFLSSTGKIRRIVQRSRDELNGFLVVGNDLVDEKSSASVAVFGNALLEDVDFAVSPLTWTAAWTDPAAGMLHIQQNSGEAFTASLNEFGECTPGRAVFSELTQDDKLDVLVACGPRLFGFYSNGVLISGFPFKLKGNVISTPVVAQRSLTGGPVIFVQTENGNLDAISIRPEIKRLNGFPLSTGKQAGFSPYVEEDRIVTLSGNGVMYTWTSTDRQGWNARQVSQMDVALGQNEAVSTLPLTSERLLSSQETYNWPNPISNGLTHIRFMVSDEADVEITIIDSAGSLIKRIESISVRPNVPTEVIWNTDAESGLYFARVQATSRSTNKSDTRLIKMAVIK